MISTTRVPGRSTPDRVPSPHDRSPRRRRRRGVAVAAALGMLLALAGPAQVALADDPPATQVKLRVLVVDDGTDYIGAIADHMDAEGVPYTRLFTSDGGRPTIDAAFLASGTTGNFQAVVLPKSTIDSGLSKPELDAIEAYAEAFGVRLVYAYENPGQHVGLQNGTSWSGHTEGLTGTLTSAAKDAGFGYLDGTVDLGIGGWVLGSTPLPADAMPAGASYTSFLTVPGPEPDDVSASVLGVYRSGTTERLVSTMSLASWQVGARLLAHGIVTWMTRGVHFGYDRNYYTMHFDDAFAYDARWSIEHKCTPGEDCPPEVPEDATEDIRMTADDVDALVDWQVQNGYQPVLAFNAFYAEHDADGEPMDPASDPLTQAFVEHKDEIVWLNHGYEHIYQGCVQDFTKYPWECETTDGQEVAPDGSNIVWVTQDDIEFEIAENIRVGRDVLDLEFDQTEYLSGEHSGMRLMDQQPVDNPNFAAALTALGIEVIGADASRETGARPVGSATTVPRHPVALYFNTSTFAEAVDEYNWFYLPAAEGGSGMCEQTAPPTCRPTPLDDPEEDFLGYILPTDVAFNMLFVLENDPRPFYAHVSNLTAPDYLGLQHMEAMLSTYDGWFAENTPLVSLSLTEAAEVLEGQKEWDETGMPAGSAVTGVLKSDGTVQITNPTAVDAPLTVPEGTTLNGSPFGESYRGERSGWVTGNATLVTPVVAPVFTGATTADFPLGVATSATVTATGASQLVATGLLPPGVTFTDNGNGTGTFAGTAGGPVWTYNEVTVIAVNEWGATSQPYTLVVGILPAFESPDTGTLTVGEAGTITVTAVETTLITLSGDLPAGVTFTHVAWGAATISGTPEAGTEGEYTVTLTASNNLLAEHPFTTEQTFTLTVAPAATPEAPAFTSPATGSLTVGVAGSIAVTATNATTITKTSGDLPAGVTFTDNGGGSATIAGTPGAGTEGDYTLTLTASNGTTSTEQTFTLTVAPAATPEAPAFTSPATGSLTVGVAGSIAVTATNATTITKTSGDLPAGVTFTDNGGGSATIAGTPGAGTEGDYTLTLTASNGTTSTEQTFTLTVAPAATPEAPAFTSPATGSLTVGVAGSIAVTATNATTITKTSGDLPAGVTFTDNGGGSATIAGTPGAGTEGDYTLTLTASNGTTSTDQTFTLTVAPEVVAPTLAFTNPAQATFATGGSNTFTFTTNGVASFTLDGALPAGVTFTDGGDGTATLAGKPTVTGTFPLVVTATAGAESVQQAFTLTVTAGPVAPMAQVVMTADMTGDGRADALGVDSAGRLYLYPGDGTGRLGTPKKIGWGWSAMRVFAPGDWNGDGRADLVAADAKGDLWLYPGKGNGTLGAKVKIGNGWSTFRIVPAGDMNGDRKVDLLGIDAQGRLWLYPGAGLGKFGKRVQVGNGWIGYDLYAAGDANRDGRNDIFSVDSAGKLWYYAGRGGGFFATRKQVGNGWNGFTFASGADLNRDGFGDLLGRDPSGRLFFYAGRLGGTFAQRVQIAQGW